MLDPVAQITVPQFGVRDAAIESLVESGIRCIVSHFDFPAAAGTVPQFRKDDALQLHHVVTAVFQQAAVIPFRFPTLLPESELRGFVKEKSQAYLDALSRLREMVQMEVRIASKASAPATPASGTEYLQALQARTKALEEAAALLRNLAGALAQDWRERPLAQGLRCYALVRRDQIGPFRERMRSLPVGDMVTLAISGPWPATEFLEPRDAGGT